MDGGAQHCTGRMNSAIKGGHKRGLQLKLFRREELQFISSHEKTKSFSCTPASLRPFIAVCIRPLQCWACSRRGCPIIFRRTAAGHHAWQSPSREHVNGAYFNGASSSSAHYRKTTSRNLLTTSTGAVLVVILVPGCCGPEKYFLRASAKNIS